MQSAGHQLFRQLLGAAGLLDVAREARGVVSSVGWLKDNSRFWLGGADDRLPVPPLRLVRSSTGISSLAWLLQGGALAADSIRNILAKNGTDIRGFGSILDFGCGCGRVMRHWSTLRTALHGCDYNRRSIAWCRQNLPFARFEVNELNPPLPYADGQFDLVYALSVFTHLPEPSLVAWMREMGRVLTPAGALIISTHGEACLGGLTEEQRLRFHAGEAVVKDEDAAGTNRCGVYVSEPYVRTRMTNGFRLVDFVPQGARGNPPQDLVLLRKQPAERAADTAFS